MTNKEKVYYYVDLDYYQGKETLVFKSTDGKSHGHFAGNPQYIIRQLMETHGKEEGTRIYLAFVNALVKVKDIPRTNGQGRTASLVFYNDQRNDSTVPNHRQRNAQINEGEKRGYRQAREDTQERS